MSGRRILIVDDDPGFRALAARVLTGWGHRVTGEAEGVGQALRLAAATHPDVAIVDVRLPDGDGFALAGMLLAMSRPPEVVVVSSDSSPAHVTAAHRAGALGFVAKEDLSEDTLRSLLDSRDRG
ncbi:hypothetical protein BA895_04760 [Humibacillus sp. DSM 29435]|uniref:response regulator n=1 Tax=Humibacillus sp. DSM 29435 TaxID=1869167 RepID=UPI000872C78A|nr:response regulator [Humibacillus sp. DSM 29435]OFE15832.1 hypothetical protein BA895_04760 [Humibacillus sp. DSM 29435]